jgi:imidazole glycerol phosphate synthase subunit HisF
MTKEESNQLAVLTSLMGGVKEDTEKIEGHLKTLNGTVAEHTLAIAKADAIAKQAETKAAQALACATGNKEVIDGMENQKDKWKIKLLAGLVVFLSTAVISLIAAWIQKP